MVCLKIRRQSLGFLPVAVETIMPTTARERQLQGALMIGVCPFGAHVLRTLALKEIPDSSQNANEAPIFLAFF